MGQSANLDYGVPVRAGNRYLLTLVPSRSTARPSIHPINRTAAQPDLVALPGERRREQEKKPRESKKQKQTIAQTGGRTSHLPATPPLRDL